MAQPRIQCLNIARRFAQGPLEMRAAFSSSAVVRADDTSRISAADGLLASLDEHASSRSPSSRSSEKQSSPQPVRLPTRQAAHTPTRSGNQRIAAMVSETLARRSRQSQNLLSGRKPGQPSLTTVQEIENAKKASDLSKQIPRRWRVGDVYSPHDLSSVEMEKWRSREGPKYDVFDVLNFKPLDNYRNFSVMSEYMSPTGRIRPSHHTGLRPVNQRKMSKAIRRSIGLGLMPSIHRHPEILQKVALKQEQSPARRN